MSNIPGGVNYAKVGREFDGRRKLSDSQEDEIRSKHERGIAMSILAGIYHVSVALIRLVLNPLLRSKYNENRKGKEQSYYSSEERVSHTNKQREKKRSLYEEGKLTLKN